jgi:hypothetical protein
MVAGGIKNVIKINEKAKITEEDIRRKLFERRSTKKSHRKNQRSISKLRRQSTSKKDSMRIKYLELVDGNKALLGKLEIS